MKETLQEREYASKPTEGKWFKVDPSSIDRSLFNEKRSDSRQEETRQLILEAFEELKKKPWLNRAFKILIPYKTWEYRLLIELKRMGSQMGDHIANWFELALEWAQRIANGESWEALCNEQDTAKCYRLIVWKNGYIRLVGGARMFDNPITISATSIGGYVDGDLCYHGGSVPLIVVVL